MSAWFYVVFFSLNTSFRSTIRKKTPMNRKKAQQRAFKTWFDCYVGNDKLNEKKKLKEIETRV